MVLPFKLKFGVCIIDHHSSYNINFGVYRMYSFFFFYRIYKMSYITAYRLKILEVCILVLLNLLKYVFTKASGVTPDIQGIQDPVYF